MTAAPKSRGRVERVKVSSDSDTLHIGAFFFFFAKCVSVLQQKKNDSDVRLTSTLVFAKSVE